MTETKKTIKEVIVELSLDQFNGSIDRAIQIFQIHKEKNPNLSLSVVTDRGSCDYEGYYDESPSISIIGTRLETDEEFKNRIEKAEKAREKAKKRNETLARSLERFEKQEYERLKKKYGN